MPETQSASNVCTEQSPASPFLKMLALRMTLGEDDPKKVLKVFKGLFPFANSKRSPTKKPLKMFTQPGLSDDSVSAHTFESELVFAIAEFPPSLIVTTTLGIREVIKKKTVMNRSG